MIIIIKTSVEYELIKFYPKNQTIKTIKKAILGTIPNTAFFSSEHLIINVIFFRLYRRSKSNSREISSASFLCYQ